MPRARQLARRERRDRALDARRRHAQRVVAVAAGVQDLQRDLAAFGVHRVGDQPVPARRPRGRQRAGEGLGPAFDVRREAAGHHQADAAARALGEVRGHGREVLAAVLQPGVHAAHQHAVGQRGEAEVQRGEQVRERCAHGIRRCRCAANIKKPRGEPAVFRGGRPLDQAAFFSTFLSKNCSSSVEPRRAAVDASFSIVVVTASK